MKKKLVTINCIWNNNINGYVMVDRGPTNTWYEVYSFVEPLWFYGMRACVFDIKPEDFDLITKVMGCEKEELEIHTFVLRANEDGGQEWVRYFDDNTSTTVEVK